MALTVNTDRRIQRGVVRNLRSAISAIPFQGSLLVLNSSGYYQPLTGAAGQPFAGICEKGIISRDQAASNGATSILARTGRFSFVAAIAGFVATTIIGRPRVYASDDNTFSLTAELGNTYIGRAVDLFTDYGDGITNGVVIEAQTFHEADQDMVGGMGSSTGADAATLLSVSQLDTVIEIPNTAARTYTLPAVAACTGRCFWLKKTTAAAFAITLQGNAAELIDGANTYATSTSQWASVCIRSDGTQWLIVAKI